MIRLTARRTEDFIAWQPGKSMMFSVRNAYNIALMEQTRAESAALSSQPDGDRKLWNNIWNCQVPPKSRYSFTWKLNKDILPTKRNKFRRRLEVTQHCDLCRDESESSHQAVV